VEYGWDRILLTGLKSSDSLIAVSGKAAVNVRSSSSHIDFTDVVGQLHAVNHDVAASPPSIEVRNAAIRSPILYDVEQVLAAGGWMSKESEHAGMGDVEVSPATCILPSITAAAKLLNEQNLGGCRRKIWPASLPQRPALTSRSACERQSTRSNAASIQSRPTV
jgi:hypothetical protein